MKLEALEYELDSFQENEDIYNLNLKFSNVSPDDLISITNLIALYLAYNPAEKETNGQENQEDRKDK